MLGARRLLVLSMGTATLLGLAISCGGNGGGGGGEKPPEGHTTTAILFVTQVPIAGFTTVTSTFGTHLGEPQAAPRGGDLMIRYADGMLRNLTREAGFGSTGMQGDNAIAVREPCVHWSGERALFSMVVGSPDQYEYTDYVWQIYEITGLGKNDTPVITKVPNQPAGFNNISPIYGSDDHVIFTSDRPRNGEMHLYPQLDEYESAATNTGLWNLDPVSGTLFMVNHTPSGAFSPMVDSYGRVIFTKWDHLQRDQQADADRGGADYGSFTYANESAGAAKDATPTGQETFPEPRTQNDPDGGDPNVAGHTFNQFFPWMIGQDGTGEETLNHVGRHELAHSYTGHTFQDDDNLSDYTPESTHKNRNTITGDGGLFQIREDPTTPGRYFATYAREFGTAGSGTLMRFDAGPSVNPEDIELVNVTHPDSYLQPDSRSGAPDSTGHYRNALPMSDGTLVAVHTEDFREIKNRGSRATPRFDHAFTLRVLKREGELYVADGTLTGGIQADVTYFDPDVEVHFVGQLWELDPVEVVARPRPTPQTPALAASEAGIFTDTGVSVEALRTWLRQNELALVISRNVTYRDRADVQQPFNLRVPGGVMTAPMGGKIYDVSFLQFFQGDAVRGYGGVSSPRRGRRLLARPMHGTGVSPAPGGAPAGSVAVASDGSIAAFVPARRAMSWQLTSPGGEPVVLERNWVSFQAGEIRTCPSCHGVNTANQDSAPEAANPPEALRTLLTAWAAAH